MFFSEKGAKQHEDNYNTLLEHYDAHDDKEFASACYIVALPEVFAGIPEGKWGSNPFTWYWGPYDQVLDRRGESSLVERLTPAPKELVRAAVEMFAGRHLHFELPPALSVWDEDDWRVFMQAVRIRTE